jgi:hypothetical protein
MAFVFQIPVDYVSDYVFPGARHLNLIDKIRSHAIQMNSNPLSLNSRVSDARALNSEVSNSKVLEASDPEVSNSSPWPRILPSQIRGLILEAQGPEVFLGFGFLGFRFGLVNYWAYQSLIHDPTPILTITH